MNIECLDKMIDWVSAHGKGVKGKQSHATAPLSIGNKMAITTETDLINTCLALITRGVELSRSERDVIASIEISPISITKLRTLRQAIKMGQDPLGEAFSLLRSASNRRCIGAVYTPLPIIRSMLHWLSNEVTPSRIVDPGAGSGRFVLMAGKQFPEAHLVAVEIDPVAALMLRANVQAAGLADRTTVIVDDYRNVTLPEIKGTTAFIGNPPYVRHHDIDAHWKAWYAERFASLGICASALAGLHLHFFLQTRLLAKVGDIGTFITSAEWMDVNYGSALRNLLMHDLGGLALHVLEPTVKAFPGTATTAAITCFRVGETERPFRVRSVSTLSRLNGLSTGTAVERERLQNSNKWSIILRPGIPVAGGEIELGELFRVHRGQVTGANKLWIASEQAQKLPARVLVPAVTKAKELIDAGERLIAVETLRRVVDLPPELDEFTAAERRHINAFLKWVRDQGGDQSYTAQHRKAWWSVGLKEPAPILCTYMARRPPQFTLNACNARHINVAHGLYPRDDIDPGVIALMISWLNQNISTTSGRTYAGGLTKFEPKEMERLRIPCMGTFVG